MCSICYNRKVKSEAAIVSMCAQKECVFRRLAWLLLLALFATSALAGCQRASRQAADQAPDVAMALSFDPNQPAVGPGYIVVDLADATGRPIEDASVALKGDMAHAGMRPVLATATGGSGGVYRAEFEWSMSGDWVVTVTAELRDGRTAIRQFDVTVSTP